MDHEHIECNLIHSFEYFKSYKKLLEGRSTYKQRLSNYDSFYSIYNVGDYTFSKYKVIWAEQSGSFKAVVVSQSNVPLIGERPYVPDHKIYYVESNDENEAHYICGIINSNLIKKIY